MPRTVSVRIEINKSVTAISVHARKDDVVSLYLMLTSAPLKLCSHNSDNSNDRDSRNPNGGSPITPTMASSSYQTHYEVLEITKQANLKEIRDAYRKYVCSGSISPLLDETLSPGTCTRSPYSEHIFKAQ